MAPVHEVDPSLRDEVQALRWFHRIELAPGLITPGQDESQAKLAQVRLPERLDGWSVLDLGAWDGFFSFEAERRGASRVAAVDPECWREPAWGPNGWGTKRPFELARRALGSKVEDLDINLQDLSPETVGQFDLVLLLGVFYHLPDPLAVMKAAASVCKGMIIVETHADLLDLKRPAMAYYPDAVDGDPSNWWGPNEALLRGLLRTDGFTRTEAFTESRARRAARSVVRRARRQPYRYQWGRLVVHGWR